MRSRDVTQQRADRVNKPAQVELIQHVLARATTKARTDRRVGQNPLDGIRQTIDIGWLMDQRGHARLNHGAIALAARDHAR